MVTPDFFKMNNRKAKCKVCGVERGIHCLSNGMCKECEKSSKNCGLGSFDK